MRIPGRAALAVLDEECAEFNALLTAIPTDIDLWDAPEETVAPGSPPVQLWQRPFEIAGVGWVTAGKLLARKRPRLIPVYDRVVKAALARGDHDEWWRPLRTAPVENPA